MTPNPVNRCIPAMTFAAALLAALPVRSHEFWIDPGRGQVGPGTVISADIRVGQDFSGTALPYLERTVQSITHWSPAGETAIVPQAGDLPAIGSLAVQTPGLHIITLETHPAYAVFDTFPEFEEYALDEGLDTVPGSHRVRGLAEINIAESYVRNTKTLVQVGQAQTDQIDRPTGLPFELVLQGNPYANQTDMLVFTLFWNGEPASGRQISMYHVPEHGAPPEDTVKITATTDHAGHAEFAHQGSGRYLFNAVRMQAADGPGSVVWHSHWASLSFEVSTVR